MPPDLQYDAVIVGSGFGGAAMARQLAAAGHSVLVLERGGPAARDASAWDARAILIDQRYRSTIPFEAPQFGGRRRLLHPNAVVGGQSVFYGAASFRFREADFERRSRFVDTHPMPDGYADWPISYADLEPWYSQAESLIGVAGVAGVDPHEPPRSAEYPMAPPPLGAPSRRLADAATRLGLTPFRIPLAINYANPERPRCIECTTCDLYPCQLGAKNDMAVTLLPQAVAAGATVRPRTAALRLLRRGERITGVACADLDTGRRFTVACEVAVVSAGAIASARLLLASGLGDVEPNGRMVGRYLMRHCAGVAIGLFPFVTNPDQVYTKQIAITDRYLGDPSHRRGPAGPWGCIQGLQVPPPEYIAAGAPFPFNFLGVRSLPYHLYLLVMAEDVPQPANRITLHPSRTDPLGEPIASVAYRHGRRDLQARAALFRVASGILREAGAVLRLRKTINTFSHQVGTCRFGTDPSRAVLDPVCRFFGLANLFVVDGSFMPTSAGVNPSLTIAANALRVGEHLAGEWAAYGGSAS